jgi:hypothetical protein
MEDEDYRVTLQPPGEVSEGALAPVARLSANDVTAPDIDGLVFQSTSHWFVFWTMDVADRRAIVGLEVRPKRKVDAEDSVPGWAFSSYQELRNDPPAPVALDAVSLRQGVSYREVMRAREEHIRQFSRPEIAGFDISVLNDEESAGLTGEELRRLENLMDAVVYDWAVGAKTSPVKAIAERRCISERTAEGRIARARAMGFLTPAVGRRASGGLSEKGWDLVRRLEKLDAIQKGGK